MPFDIPRLLLPATLVLLGACASTPPSSVSVQEDSECPLHLSTGQTLILSLTSNPASGYRWSLQQASPELMTSLGPEVFTAQKNLVGGDGVSTWRFQARQAGTGRLLLAYQRPWESGMEPAGLFDCRVVVE